MRRFKPKITRRRVRKILLLTTILLVAPLVSYSQTRCDVTFGKLLADQAESTVAKENAYQSDLILVAKTFFADLKDAKTRAQRRAARHKFQETIKFIAKRHDVEMINLRLMQAQERESHAKCGVLVRRLFAYEPGKAAARRLFSFEAVNTGSE